jgi:N-carbamoyl-L-amino-acid hydrolase
VGLIQSYPNSRNVIPGQVFFTIDIRHPEDNVLSQMDAQVRAAVELAAQQHGLSVAFEEIWYSPPIAFNDQCVSAVREAAQGSGYSYRDIVSGAGHDACYISRIAPTAMVFVPCEDGISHNEAENAKPEHLTAGCQVLLGAVLSQAVLL